MKITVDGDRLTIDFTGTDTRPEIQAWSTFGNTRGLHVAQIAAMMDPEIPKNEGFFDSIELVVPPGLRAQPAAGQAGVAPARTIPGAEVGEVIAVAMQHVLPDKAVPQTYKTGIPTIIVGVDPRTGAVVHRPLGRGLRRLVQRGARAWTRWGAQNASFGNLWKATAEINESLFPHVQWSRDYRTDSGGAGPVARPLRQPLREGSARRRQGLHVRRRHEVPDARHLRRQARRAEPADDPLRLRRPVRRRSTPPTGCRSSAGQRLMLRLRRRRRLGRPARPRPAGGARRRARRVRVASRAPSATTASCSPARSTTSRSRSTRPPPTTLRAERRAA